MLGRIAPAAFLFLLFKGGIGHRILWPLFLRHERGIGHHTFQSLLDRKVALGDLAVQGPVSLQRVPQHKEVFLSPVSQQRRFHFFHRALAHSFISQLDQFFGIPLPSQNRIEDSQSGFPVQIADHVVQVDVHLVQGSLHVLNLLTTPRHQVGAMAQITSQTANILGRVKGSVEQPIAVQLLQPLAIQDVGFAPWHSLQMLGVDQDHLHASHDQLRIQGHPVNPGGLHGHRRDLALPQPLDQLIQLRGERSKLPHRRFPSRHRVLGNADAVFGRAHINAGGLPLYNRQALGRLDPWTRTSGVTLENLLGGLGFHRFGSTCLRIHRLQSPSAFEASLVHSSKRDSSSSRMPGTASPILSSLLKGNHAD